MAGADSWDRTGFRGGLVCNACGHWAPKLDETTRVVPVEGKPHTYVFEHVNCPAERTHCALCGRTWHPATGYIVGNPQKFPACGVCGRELWKFLEAYTGKRVRGYAFYELLVPGLDPKPEPRKSKKPPKWMLPKKEG